MSEYNDEDSPDSGLPKDKDFGTVIMDGVIVKIDNEVCRLIFYQEPLKLTDREQFEENEPLLKFEVRLPFTSTLKLGDDIHILTEVLSKSNRLEERAQNQTTKKGLRSLRHRIYGELFDTNAVGYTSKAEDIEVEYKRLEENDQLKIDKEDDLV